MPTAEALQTLRSEGAPVPLLDFVAWAGPWLETQDDPASFYATYQLALAQLAEGRPGLRGSLVRRPPRVYLALTLAADRVARAYRGPDFAFEVAKARLVQVPGI